MCINQLGVVCHIIDLKIKMKYNQSKDLKAIEIFKILQHLTLKNAMLIKSNNDIMNSCTDLNELKKYADLTKENHELTRQNISYLELHNRLLIFIKSLKDISLTDIDIVNIMSENEDITFDRDEFFNQTIHDVISFDEEHPFFNDEEFKKELIDYYTKNEEYEKCIKLKNKK
jgi:hypothetical protein